MRKILASLVVLVMVLSMMTLTAMAAGEHQIVVEQVTAQAGESVDVDVSLENNPGINTFTLSIEYDKDRLQLTGLTMNAGLGGSHNFSANTEAVTWLASADTSYNGVAFTLHFDVLEDANAGNAEVTVTYSAGGICNFNEEDVDFGIQPGGVNITCSHSFDYVGGDFAPTCDENGWIAFYICDRCGKAFKLDGVTETTAEAQQIPALGHDMADATCTKPAMCKREGCGYIDIDGEPQGHSYKAEWEKNEKGHWHICNVCEEPGELAAHVPGAPATEETAQTCTVCGFEISGPEPHIHTTSKVEGFAATCTQAGQKTYYTCPCGEWFEDAAATVEIADHTGIVIAALGHNWVDATCQALKHCDRCSQTDGEPLPHTEGEWKVDSKEHWKTCASCKTELEATRQAHTEGEWKVDSKEHWKTCASCEAELEATRQAHTDADADGICEICGKEIPVTPPTGDRTNINLLVCAMLVTMAATAAMLTFKKRYNR